MGPLRVEGRLRTLVLECKDRSEFGSVILPFVRSSPGNCVQVDVVEYTGGVDRLLEAERGPSVDFVIQSSNGTLAHQKRQWCRVVDGRPKGVAVVKA